MHFVLVSADRHVSARHHSVFCIVSNGLKRCAVFIAFGIGWDRDRWVPQLAVLEFIARRYGTVYPGFVMHGWSARRVRVCAHSATVTDRICWNLSLTNSRQNRKQEVKKSIIVISTAALAVAVFLVGASFYSSSQTDGAVKAASENAELLGRENSPIYGEESARVTIVEFLDPACEACRAFHPIVKHIVDSSFGQVNVRIRYAAFHKGSADAIRLLEAARDQGKFWPVLEMLFKTQQQWASHQNPNSSLIWTLVDGMGIDVAKAKEYAMSSEVDEVLAREMNDVKKLQVRQTPTFYVNGKPLTEFGERQLRSLVGRELNATGK